MYEPKPLDTTNIELPEDINNLVEKLAENTHDIWAQQRIKDGWTYGEKRGCESKTHPCLVPYKELPESEKEYDRKISMDTLKALLVLGYKIDNKAKEGNSLNYDNYIFDIDGTLIDSKGAFVESLKETVLKFFPEKYKEDKIENAFGMSVMEAIKFLEMEDIPELKDFWERRFNEMSARSVFFEGISEVIKKLYAAGKRIFILTSRSYITLEPVLKCNELINKVTGYVSTDDTKKHKPFPDPLFKIMDKWKCKIENTVFIGDSQYDQQCAENAKVDFGLAAWGAVDKSIPCKYHLKSPADIL